jgi:Tol biopolymer transport system component
VTEAQDTTDRKAKWMRRTARILAVIWASLLTCAIAAFAYLLVLMCGFDVPRPRGECVAEVSIVFLPVVLLLWVPAIVAWRREAIGGALLVIEGLLVFTLAASVCVQDMLQREAGTPAFLLLIFVTGALPPLVAGILFLATRRKSYLATISLATLCPMILCLVVLSLAMIGLRGNLPEHVPLAWEGPYCNLPEPSLSADARYVAFASRATDLVPGDTNDRCDVFVHDRQMGRTERISVASDGTPGNWASGQPCISADGRYVAFVSSANNLIPGDTNDEWDIFLHDRETGETTRVSVASDGRQASGNSQLASISADGRYVAFQSSANNLVPGDTNNASDVFVHDRLTRETTRVSVASDGTEAIGLCHYSSISADGRYVAFTSYARNLLPADTKGSWHVFVHDRLTEETTPVSVASHGTEAIGLSHSPSISADGRYVAFTSDASNLVSADTNAAEDIFVHDLETGETGRVSVTSDDMEGNDNSVVASISADGRYVAFESAASNLVAHDTYEQWDMLAQYIYVHDRQTGQTSLGSVRPDGTPGGGYSPSISPDGRYVVFGYGGVLFVHDRETGETSRVLVVSDGSARD